MLEENKNKNKAPDASMAIMAPIAPPQKDDGRPQGNFKASLAVIFLTAFISIAGFVAAVDNYKATQEFNLEKRMTAIVASQAAIVENITTSQIRLGHEQVEFPLLQIILSEGTDNLPQGILPRLQETLHEFRNKNKLHSSIIFNNKGLTFLASSSSDEINTSQYSKNVEEVLKSKRSILMPLRENAGRIYLDVVHPIFTFQENGSSEGQTAVGVLITSADLTETATKALSSTIDGSDANSLLIFESNNQTSYLTDSGKVGQTPETVKDFADGMTLGSSSIQATQPVYLLAHKVENTNWFILRETSESVVGDSVSQFSIIGGIISLLVTAVISACVLVVWMRQRNARQRMLAKQYKEFAGRLQFQNRFVESINKAVPDVILLKNSKGEIIYANPSAQGMFEVSHENLIGKTDKDIVGKETALWVKHLDYLALKEEGAVSDHFTLEKGTVVKNLAISSTPIKISDETEEYDFLNVIRDITDIVKSQDERVRQTEKTVLALVSIIERHDPYLKGHSNQLSQLSMAVGRKLGLSSNRIRTLNYAGSLSQIGKSFIPKELLAKTERLTEDEIQQVNKHIDYTIDTISTLNMPDGVTKAISQMYERLDGSGYPDGITDEDICLEAKILGTTDVLIARISDRSYRRGIDIDEALSILKANVERYDPEVTNALALALEDEDCRNLLNL
jgi:PAS domain S-box-containing protein